MNDGKAKDFKVQIDWTLGLGYLPRYTGIIHGTIKSSMDDPEWTDEEHKYGQWSAILYPDIELLEIPFYEMAPTERIKVGDKYEIYRGPTLLANVTILEVILEQ